MNFIRNTVPSSSGAPSPRPPEAGAGSAWGAEKLSPAARVARLAWFDLASGATCRALAAAAVVAVTTDGADVHPHGI